MSFCHHPDAGSLRTSPQSALIGGGAVLALLLASALT
jgi:hypothetical protein